MSEKIVVGNHMTLPILGKLARAGSAIVMLGIVYILVPIMVTATTSYLWPGWQYGNYRDVIFLLVMIVMIGLVAMILTHPATKRCSDWFERTRHEE